MLASLRYYYGIIKFPLLWKQGLIEEGEGEGKMEMSPRTIPSADLYALFYPLPLANDLEKCSTMIGSDVSYQDFFFFFIGKRVIPKESVLFFVGYRKWL